MEMPTRESESKKETMIRVKTDPNGDYRLVDEDTYREMQQDEEEGKIKMYESYEFLDVEKDKNGNLTGINNAGQRVNIEE